MATSGSYRKFYEKNGIKYSHTLDPFTGFSTENKLLSVTVIHDECMLADAYATAFMVMGISETKKFVKAHPGIDVFLVFTSNNGNWETYMSPRMKERVNN